MNIFLSPHNDDEVLFGCYTLLRERPHVIVVLRSHKQETAYGFQYQPGFTATASVREQETARAMAIVGCTWEQWEYLDSDPDWNEIEDEIRALDWRGEYLERVYAPAVETEGHPQHNQIGLIAQQVFGFARVTHYMTYTNGRGRSRGVPVDERPGWADVKRNALICYQSQIALESTRHHFEQPLDEWYAP